MRQLCDQDDDARSALLKRTAVESILWERVSTVLFFRRDLNLEGALLAARAWAAHDARDFEAKLRADEACGRW